MAGDNWEEIDIPNMNDNNERKDEVLTNDENVRNLEEVPCTIVKCM